jgi:hypothetical protein
MIEQQQGLTSSDGITYRLVPLEWIIPNPENYNQHPLEQIEALKADFKRFGQVKPYVVKQKDETTFMLSAGEGCTIAAGELLQEDPKKYAHLGTAKIMIVPDWWTDDDVEGFMTADNETARMSYPDEAKFIRILQRQQEAGYDLRSLGTDEETLRQMLANLGDEETGEYSEGAGGDDFDVAPEEEQTRVKPGDTWQLGRHKIACVDSCDAEQVERLVGDEQITFVWADPPYGIAIVGKDGHIGGGGGGIIRSHAMTGLHGKRAPRNNTFAPVIGDESKTTAHISFQLCTTLYPKALQVWWGANHYSDGLPSSSCWIIWDKENEGTDFADAELAWCSHKGAVRIFRHMWNGMCKDSEQGIRRVHPNQKPAALAKWVFEKYGHDDDLIYDPFLGSGISVIAGERLERTVYGCELSPAYINVVIQRWEKETGQQAHLLERIEVPS